MNTKRGSPQRGAAWLVVLVALAVGLAGYGGWKAYKKSQVRAAAAAELKLLEEFDEKLGLIWRRWSDAFRIAASSPRITVPAHIAAMQAAVRDFDALVDVACVKPARIELRRVLQASVEGMLAFVQQDAAAQAMVEAAAVEAATAADAMRKAKSDCAISLQRASK